jgi:hypothetical protein
MGFYDHPSDEHHPLIDRAVIDSTDQYAILYQHNLDDDASAAVASLNSARNKLLEDDKLHGRAPRQFICVANCLGAKGKVTCQNNFESEYYALITNDDLARLYTPTLAHIFRYLCGSLEQPGEG